MPSTTTCLLLLLVQLLPKQTMLQQQQQLQHQQQQQLSMVRKKAVEKKPVFLSMLLPSSNNNPFYKRDVYMRRLQQSPYLVNIHHYNIQPDNETIYFLKNVLYPMEIVHLLCDELIKSKVSAVVVVSGSEKYDLSTASMQYLFHMLSYTGIPIIAWNADSSGLMVDQSMEKYRLLQLAPPIEHQIEAIAEILTRYMWSKFAIVTGTIAGNRRFVNIFRQYEMEQTRQFRLELIKEMSINTKNESDIEQKMLDLQHSEARIILLYATQSEAIRLLRTASDRGMTGDGYLWIATQSVVGNPKSLPESFPTGMIGVHFDTRVVPKSRVDSPALAQAVESAVDVFGAAIKLIEQDYNGTVDLLSNANCDSDTGYSWSKGALVYEYLNKVSVQSTNKDAQVLDVKTEFDGRGMLKSSYLSIMNVKKSNNWEKVGYYANGHLEMYDITWPGNQPSPPKGTPEKIHMRIVTLDEPPFINVNEPDAVTGLCQQGQSICHWEPMGDGKNFTDKCCSGYCIDLLNKLANDVGFTYDLYRVEDNTWGIKNDKGQWNGLVADLVTQKADMCVTALKINSDRQRDIEFSAPFLETGITILVAYRQGALSPTAFLEPFEYGTWVFMLMVSIRVAALAIFLFEWLSPASFNRTTKPPDGHKFSLFRSFWLVWATLFNASVTTDVPKSQAARFMALIWAAFSLTFLAVYTANLAAFMISRSEFYNLVGIEDPRVMR